MKNYKSIILAVFLLDVIGYIEPLNWIHIGRVDQGIQFFDLIQYTTMIHGLGCYQEILRRLKICVINIAEIWIPLHTLL